jgi:predicted SAM-dependent methyltransferase
VSIARAGGSGVLSRIGVRVNRELGFIRRKFVTPRSKVSADGKLRLHIGCGQINSPHFTNIDALPYPHVHIVSNDILRLPMFQNACADMVYMCHVLEHVPRKQLGEVIRELRRVLKIGGVLRLSVPDFDLLLAMYKDACNDVTAIADPLLGSHSNEYDVHYAMFNRRFLTELLLRNGFREVRGWDPHHCEFHDFDDWASKTIDRSGISYPVSLNIEGIR